MSERIAGKLFVAGEYAVTRPGGLAIVLAVDTDFEVFVSESRGKSRLSTNVDLADFLFDIEDFEIPENAWNFALTALSKVIEGQKNLPQLDIRIESGLGFGENKTGYGSSASVVVGIVRAVSSFLKLEVNEFERAAQAHLAVQGSGSMGDVAAISSGGLIDYQSPDEHFQNWKIHNLELPAWTPYVIKTGKSVKTGEKLKIELPESFYTRSDELVREISASIQNKDFASFKKNLLANQALLIEHLPESYLTDDLRNALERVNELPHAVAKVSGSGFGENLIVFAESLLDLTHLERLKVAEKKHDY